MRINKLEAKVYCMKEEEEEEEGKTESVVRLEKLNEDITVKTVKIEKYQGCCLLARWTNPMKGLPL